MGHKNTKYTIHRWHSYRSRKLTSFKQMFESQIRFVNKFTKSSRSYNKNECQKNIIKKWEVSSVYTHSYKSKIISLTG